MKTDEYPDKSTGKIYGHNPGETWWELVINIDEQSEILTISYHKTEGEARRAKESYDNEVAEYESFIVKYKILESGEMEDITPVVGQ